MTTKSDLPPLTIAFLGLGNMGCPMAANLVKNGHRVLGYDPVPAACDQAKEFGVVIEESAVKAVSSAEVVITMLPAGTHVISAYEKDILPAVKANTLLIDCSTIDVESARKVAGLATSRRLDMVDAPVSGGVSGAAAATLTFMVGGAEKAYNRSSPILDQLGKAVIHCGEAGAGQAAKICNNLMLGIQMIGVCESFALAEKIGLAPDKLFNVASRSSGQCWSLTSYCPSPGLVETAPSNREYQGGFSAALMLKDLSLALQAQGIDPKAASSSDVSPQGLSQEAAALYRTFVERGYGGLDFSALLPWFKGAL